MEMIQGKKGKQRNSGRESPYLITISFTVVYKVLFFWTASQNAYP